MQNIRFRNVATHAGFAAVAVAAAILTASCSRTPEPAAQPAPAAGQPAGTPPPAAAPAPTAAERDAASPPATAAQTPPPATTSGAEAAPAAKPAVKPPPPPPPPPPPKVYTLREGRAIDAYTTTTLSTKTNTTGERFTATLAESIVHDGWVVAKKGARVEGLITDSDSGERVKGLASLSVTLDSLTLADGRTVRLSASQFTREAKSTKGKDAKKIGIGAGVGTAIGAIAGGGKGAAIGAAVGGGAGAGAVLATKGDPAVIPAETRVRVTMRVPVTIEERK